MNHELTVTGSIDIIATPEKIWEGLTNPEIIKEYLYGTETVTDWKPGSEVVFQGEYNGQKYRDHGVVMENIPNKLLSYSYWSGFSGTEDKPENYSSISYKIEPKDDKTTTFYWIQKGYASEENYKHSLEGMEDFMASIKAVIEKS